jgi:hypothetical protein
VILMVLVPQNGSAKAVRDAYDAFTAANRAASITILLIDGVYYHELTEIVNADVALTAAAKAAGSAYDMYADDED